LVLQDTLTAGTLVAFVLYIDRFFDPSRELAQRYNTVQAAMAGSEVAPTVSIFLRIWPSSADCG
jgi:ABC-type multidrug transport system fused ATPase/permease subunit